jgi:hypothetical protein
MNKEFIHYEEALALKELGFDKPCFGYYYTTNGKDWQFAEKSEYYRLDDEINIGSKFSLSAPTFSQAFRWFREKYKVSPIITCYSELRNAWKYHIPNEGGEQGFNTYEEAELECLIKLIEIVKENKQ